MKRHSLRRLRASILQTQAWSIHEPALEALMSLFVPGQLAGSIDADAINARLGLSSRDVSAQAESTVQMIGGLAVLPVMGVLQLRPSWFTRALGWTAIEQLERDFRAAASSDQVKAIVLYCDSPGGVAAGCDEMAATIFAARGKKPIHAFVRGQCCSAAYYIASAASRIVATSSSMVGSIGTIFTHVEYAEAIQKMGMGVTVIKHGERKGDGNPYEKLTPAARSSLQSIVSAYGEMFDNAVAKHRSVSVADVKARFGQGQSFLAAAAQERGMIDQVNSWEGVLSSLKAYAVQEPQQPGHLAALNLDPFGFNPISASANPAGVSAGPVTVLTPPAAGSPAGLPVASVMEVRPVKVSARVRAALFARGLIAASDADEAVCVASLQAYFAARGEACPQEDEKICNALFAVAAVAAASGGAATAPQQAGNTAGGTPAPQGGAAANVQAAHDKELAEARTAAAGDERKRSTAIKASAKLLGLDEAAVTAAIDGGKPHAEVVAAWHEQLAGKEKPISQGGQTVNVGQEGIERYVNDATIACLLHLGQNVPEAQVTPQIRQLSNAPLIVHAQQCLQAANVRFDPYDREATAQAALAMDGYEHTVIRADIGYNRPGSFPNLLSNLANKVLDEGVQLADTSYEAYTGRWPGDLPDFKPAPVVSKGKVGELDEVLDAEEFKEQGLAEECLSYMQLARFGNSIALTPVLLANDDLSAFLENLLGLSEGWELTVNRGCLRLVTGNAYLLDGYQLYDDTNHLNHIASGGAAPGDAAWDAMQVKMASQTVIGNKGYARTRLAVALVPPALERSALQAFLPMRDIGEMKQPATDSNLNVYRGRVTVAVEPELTATSAVEWYGFADPRRFAHATIIRAYFRGFGRAGKRERWYDPQTKCYYVSLEGRAGFAAKQFRTTIKNKGAA